MLDSVSHAVFICIYIKIGFICTCLCISLDSSTDLSSPTENMASQTLPPRQDKLTDSVDGETFCEKQEYSDYDGGTESEKLNNEGKIQKAQEIQTEDIDHKSEDSIVEELSQDDQSDIDIEAVHLVEVESNISSFTNMRKPAASAAVHEDQSWQQSTKPKGNYTDTSIYHYYIFCKLQYKYIKIINNS